MQSSPLTRRSALTTATGLAATAALGAAPTAAADEKITRKASAADLRGKHENRKLEGKPQAIGISGLCYVFQGDEIPPQERPIGVTVPPETRFVQCSVNVWDAENAGPVTGVVAFAYRDAGRNWVFIAGIQCSPTAQSTGYLCVEFIFWA